MNKNNNDLVIYCMSLYDHYLENAKKLGYIPVGLGSYKFRDQWLRDNTGENISKKNKYYGEYSFYYWFWKNKLAKMNDGEWVGFSHYRHHWSNQNNIKSDELNKIVDKNNFEKYILKNKCPEWDNYDVILGDPMNVSGRYKASKIIKKGMGVFLRNPKSFLKKNRNIKLHFDVYHGRGILDKSIELLDDSEKDDFRTFVNTKKSFNRENMFICRSKKLMDEYFSSVFSWLLKCENIFGFNLEGYKMTRIYTFLAERYISYWFNKYSKPLSWPVFFFDTHKNRLNIKN